MEVMEVVENEIHEKLNPYLLMVWIIKYLALVDEFQVQVDELHFYLSVDRILEFDEDRCNFTLLWNNHASTARLSIQIHMCKPVL